MAGGSPKDEAASGPGSAPASGAAATSCPRCGGAAAMRRRDRGNPFLGAPERLVCADCGLDLEPEVSGSPESKPPW